MVSGGVGKDEQTTASPEGRGETYRRGGSAEEHHNEGLVLRSRGVAPCGEQRREGRRACLRHHAMRQPKGAAHTPEGPEAECLTRGLGTGVRAAARSVGM